MEKALDSFCVQSARLSGFRFAVELSGIVLKLAEGVIGFVLLAGWVDVKMWAET